MNQDICKFINNYVSKRDRKNIKIDWKNDNDKNAEYRDKIINYITENKSKVNNEVILRDLFLAEANFSGEIWGESINYRKTANLLIEKTGVKFVYDFIKGSYTSFDTESASLCVLNLKNCNIENLLKKVDNKIKRTKSKRKILKLKVAQKILSNYIEK